MLVAPVGMGSRLHLAPAMYRASLEEMRASTLFSVGHSTRTQGEILELLKAHDIDRVVDVRAYPGSRKHPHVRSDRMAGWLADGDIAYEHLPELGGRRRPQPDSPNGAWTNKQFQAYADYMSTDDFQRGLSRLLELCGETRTTCMCSEAQWWRCHRRMICDAALVAGHPAVHLMSPTRTIAHELTPFAVVRAGQLSYPG